MTTIQRTGLLERVWGTQWSLRPLAALRIGLGVAALVYYLSNYSEREYLFGPYAVWPWSQFLTDVSDLNTFNLYALGRSEFLFELLYHLGMVVALLFMLGWHSRVLTIVHWAFMWSLYGRNPALLDGGDNLNYIVLIFMFVTNSGARWSLDARRRARRQSADTLSEQHDTLFRKLTNLLHNAGVLAILLQACVMYFAAGLYKVQGEMWTNGTALYYIMRVPEFTLPGVSELIFTNKYLVYALTYGSMLLLAFFPLLVLNRYTRIPATLAIMGFHFGTAVMMGLTGFALVAMSVDMMFIPDRHLGAFVTKIRTLASALRNRLRGEPPAAEIRPATPAADDATPEVPEPVGATARTP